MKAVILITSLLTAASAGPVLVNVNGVYLPQHYGSSPYPTAYGYAAGPAHAIHVPQAVRTVPVATVITAPVASLAAATPVAAVRTAPVAPLTAATLVAAVPAVPAVSAVVKSAPVAAVAVQAAPVAAATVKTVTSSQYHAQDEAGNYKYGYNNINSAKEAAGNVHKHYEAGYYTDHARTVKYVADVNGFREV